MDSLIIANAIIVHPESSSSIDLEKNDKKSECGCQNQNVNQRGACICIDCKCHLRKRMEYPEQKGLEKEFKYLGGSILCTTLVFLVLYGFRVL